VWKPLEWAEMPRIACIETGRPIMVGRACARPNRSRGSADLDLLESKAASASSAAMRRMVAAGCPVSADRFGSVSIVEEARGHQLERRHGAAAVGERGAAAEQRRARGIEGAADHAGGIERQRMALSSRAIKPSSAAPGSSITSQAALV
jgi:hypothetical protein